LNDLSINQADIDERQSQVCMVGYVYCEVERVLCWLCAFNPPDKGEATCSSGD
jgi:hypothetical protein